MIEEERHAECSNASEASIPDYNQRLGYGTDQGMWLMKQVAPKTDELTAKRRARPPRAFHEVAEEPGAKKPGMSRNAGSGAESVASHRGNQLRCNVAIATAGLVALVLLLYTIFR